MDPDLEMRSLDLQDEQYNLLEIQATNQTQSPINHNKGPRASGIKAILMPELFSGSKNLPSSLKSTAYLDGLRGVAAFIVYVAHSEAWNHDVDQIQAGYGYRGSYLLITLPFFRVFFTGGHAAVAVFFVISGYVLSRRPLSLIHKKSDDVYPALASAVFRRPIRLYFPFISVTLLFLTSWHLFGIELEWPRPQPTFLLELANWWSEFSQFVYPFKTPSDTWFSYDFPLWTIPIEFQGSMLVFIALLAFSRVTIRARAVFIVSMAAYFHLIGGWQMFCFLVGVILAEIDLLHAASQIVWPSQKVFQIIRANSRIVFICVFLIGMYLAGQPSLKTSDVAAESPGWRTLVWLIPTVYMENQWWRFWHSLAAPLLVLSISHISFLRGLLETRFPQYLGRISFALYLIHIPVAITLGDKVFRMTGYVRPLTRSSGWDGWVTIPNVGPIGLETSFLVPQLIILPVTLYLSEVATKLFDAPSIALGRLLYEKVIDW